MTDLAREYGEGLLELARDENLLDTVQEELNGVRDIFRAEPRFLQLLNSHALSKEERLAVLDQTFRGKIHIYLLNFMKLLLERGAIDAIDDCAKYYHTRYCEELGIVTADVTCAAELTDSQREQLISKLSGISGKKIELRVHIDPAVISGLRVDMDGYRYDNTIQHRLNLMRRRLADEA